MNANNTTNTDVYLDEYTRRDSIARYISKTAGAGIAYALSNVYAPMYLRVLQKCIRESPKGHRFRILEYGCGGGMNLLKLAELLHFQGAELDRAYGTDFSPPMVEAARTEAALHLTSELNRHITYAVARNETLTSDLSSSLEIPRRDLDGSIDVVVGVNTTRYGHRLGKENDCAKDLFNLLRPGGYSIMIDMNRSFPFFRSKYRDLLTVPKAERYIPSLQEYIRPFHDNGFEILESGNFCWIPHSAGPVTLRLMRQLSSTLDACFSRFAIRSMVVAKKPGK